MIIKAKFGAFDKAVQLISSMFASKTIKEDAKNIIFWCKDNTVKVVGYSLQVACMNTLECTVEDIEDEAFFGFKAKELQDILSSVRSMKKTYVSDITLEVSEGVGSELTIHEEPIDVEDEFADSYRRATRFKLKHVPMPESRKNEIVIRMADSEDDNWEAVNVGEALVYINTLLPLAGTDERGVNNFSNKINFANDKAYVIPLTHGVIMTNIIEPFDNILFTSSMLGFIKNMVSTGDVDAESVVEVSKKYEGDMVLVKISKDDTIASIKTYSGTKCFKLKDIEFPQDAIATDKEYLCDVLKRMALSKSDVKCTIDLNEGKFTVESNVMVQDLPVLKAKGEGVYEFSLSTQIISSMILSHATFQRVIFFYVEHNDKGKVNIVCTDASKIASTGERTWYSYIENVAVKGVSTKW